jgi:hypothetical protein
MTAFKMLEVVEPDNAKEGRVRPLPPLYDKAGRCIPGGTTLTEGKLSAVELAEMPELQEGTELAKMPKLDEICPARAFQPAHPPCRAQAFPPAPPP